jgi:hypothetical protein
MTLRIFVLTSELRVAAEALGNVRGNQVFDDQGQFVCSVRSSQMIVTPVPEPNTPDRLHLLLFQGPDGSAIWFSPTSGQEGMIYLSPQTVRTRREEEEATCFLRFIQGPARWFRQIEVSADPDDPTELDYEEDVGGGDASNGPGSTNITG